MEPNDRSYNDNYVKGTTLIKGDPIELGRYRLFVGEDFPFY